MTRASRWLRRAEITLWVIGLSLLGVALAATVSRWRSQAEQERAFDRKMAASQPAPPSIELVSQRLSPEVPGIISDLPPGSSGEIPVQDDVSREAREADAEGSIEAAHTTPPASDATVSEKAGATPQPQLRESDPALDPDLIGRIEISRVGLTAFVRLGDDEVTLRNAVGLVRGTAQPGSGGNTALAGHRDTFFRPLRNLEVNDRIKLVVPPHTYEYRVDSMRVVKPSEISVLESTGVEELTLVTCHPFNFIGAAPDRFIVKATRIE